MSLNIKNSCCGGGGIVQAKLKPRDVKIAIWNLLGTHVYSRSLVNDVYAWMFLVFHRNQVVIFYR